MCACFVCACIHAYSCMGRTLGVLFYCSPTYLRQGYSLNPMLSILVRLAGQLAPGVCLSLLSSMAVSDTCGHAQTFYGHRELRSSCFNIRYVCPLHYLPSPAYCTSANKYNTVNVQQQIQQGCRTQLFSFLTDNLPLLLKLFS